MGLTTAGIASAKSSFRFMPSRQLGRSSLARRRGWHRSFHSSPSRRDAWSLPVPDIITLLPRPARSSELDPVGNLWQFMRDNWLGNRIFRSYADIRDHGCEAGNTLIAQPRRITSIGLRQWAHA